MKEIKVSQFSLIMPVQIGTITGKKIDKLTKDILGSTHLAKTINIPGGLLCVSESNDENILINPERLAYTKTGNNIDEKSIEKLFETIMDTLMVDEETFAVIDIQGVSPTDNSFEESKNIFNAKYSNALDKYPDVYGFGYRFLTRNENSVGEFKIEPLLANNKLFFYQLILNYNMKKSNFREYIKDLKENVLSFNSLFEQIQNNIK